MLFRSLVAMELRAYISYARTRDELSFFRTTQHLEIDFVVSSHTAIEVKSSENVNPRHIKPLQLLMNEQAFSKAYLVSLDPVAQKIGDVLCLDIKTFLAELWAGKIF